MSGRAEPTPPAQGCPNLEGQPPFYFSPLHFAFFSFWTSPLLLPLKEASATDAATPVRLRERWIGPLPSPLLLAAHCSEFAAAHCRSSPSTAAQPLLVNVIAATLTFFIEKRTHGARFSCWLSGCCICSSRAQFLLQLPVKHPKSCCRRRRRKPFLTEGEEGPDCYFVVDLQIRTTMVSEPGNDFNFPVLLWTGDRTSQRKMKAVLVQNKIAPVIRSPEKYPES
ncbi:hypothetical protein M9H77_12766 [Catharanthus roseus]|uniref:Uncharacterized protein n=1 Tax=Catharanthus roseus TaxID=4058 RepID=A0ACC0BII3_CATRO|nr:hypothetical protein M9H77_12766 [Catharanthus roseus]